MTEEVDEEMVELIAGGAEGRRSLAVDCKGTRVGEEEGESLVGSSAVRTRTNAAGYTPPMPVERFTPIAQNGKEEENEMHFRGELK